MLELYDVFHTSLGAHPILDNTRYEKEHYCDCLIQIRNFLVQHEGEMAMFVKVEGKKILPPKLVQIHQINKNAVILRYKVYDNNGNFRQYLTEFVGYTSIYSRQIQLKIFGNI